MHPVFIKKSFLFSRIYKKLCSDFIFTHHNRKFNRVSDLPCWNILLSFVIVGSHLPEVPLHTFAFIFLDDLCPLVFDTEGGQHSVNKGAFHLLVIQLFCEFLMHFISYSPQLE